MFWTSNSKSVASVLGRSHLERDRQTRQIDSCYVLLLHYYKFLFLHGDVIDGKKILDFTHARSCLLGVHALGNFALDILCM